MRILLIGAGYVGQRVVLNWPQKEDRFTLFTTTQEKVPMLQQLPQVAQVITSDLDKHLAHSDAIIICVAPKNKALYEQTYLDTAKYLHSHLMTKPERDFETLENQRDFFSERTLDHAHPRYLLYTSSTSVYGPQESEWIDESVAPQPLSTEGNILLKTEQTYLDLAQHGLAVCILRLGGIYGPERTLEERAQHMSGKEMPGEGNRPTNHIHVDDIVHAITFCCKKELRGVFNLVSDAHPTRQELYTALCQRAGLPPPTWSPYTTPAHGSNSRISNRKIKEMGFQFRHPTLEPVIVT